MKLRFPALPTRRFLKWTQFSLLAAAIVSLGYCAYVEAGAWIFQKTENRHLDRLLADRRPSTVEPHPAPPSPQINPAPPATGDLIGRIEIPRIGISLVVMEGTDPATLRRALGHIPGTGLPGHSGNIGISGHRDTFFRPLRNIRVHDVITLTTPLGEFRYGVVSTRIVDPADVAVLNPDGSEILTLVTCYPFYFVGPAPRRFIVRAERLENSL